MHGGGAVVLGIARTALPTHWDHSFIRVINSRSGVEMGKSSSAPWWSSLGFGKPAPAEEMDYADMGTAFGLDASMGKQPLADDQSSLPNKDGRPPSDGAGRRLKS
jgi:hypothetical protein